MDMHDTKLANVTADESPYLAIALVVALIAALYAVAVLGAPLT